MKLIKLGGKNGRGKFAIVDDEDYEWLNQWGWHCNSEDYVIRCVTVSKYKQKTIRMHRLILNTPNDMRSDHKDLNTLNNQRHNLRICTSSQNRMNTKKVQNKSSKYKGVSWYKGTKTWFSRISLNKKLIYLGQFKDEIAAAKTYDKKATELFGKFVRLNFPL